MNPPTPSAQPRRCPICSSFITRPLTIDEWHKEWEAHRLSDNHKKELKKQPDDIHAAIKCGGEGCWEIIVVAWHPAKLKRYNSKTGKWHLKCRDEECKHSNVVETPVNCLSIPITTLWESYPEQCKARYGPIEFRSSLSRGRAKHKH
jgi:hypothetical protein